MKKSQLVRFLLIAQKMLLGFVNNAIKEKYYVLGTL